MCQTQYERFATQRQRDAHNGAVYSPFGSCVLRFDESYHDNKIYLHYGFFVHKVYKFVLDTPSNHYARGKVVFKNENSDA